MMYNGVIEAKLPELYRASLRKNRFRDCLCNLKK